MKNSMEGDIAETLKGMSPQEARVFLARIKREAIEQVAKEQAQKLERQNETPLLTGEYKMNQRQKKFYKKFDEQRLGEIPELHKRRRQEMIELTGWEPGMGLCPLHFQDKPLGSQCTWTVNWHRSSGHLYPKDYYAIEYMTAIELLVEATDLCHLKRHNYGVRAPDKIFINREIVPIVKAHESGEIPNLHTLKKKLRQARISYSEVIAPFDLPENVVNFHTRNGWGSRQEILKALGRYQEDKTEPVKAT